MRIEFRKISGDRPNVSSSEFRQIEIGLISRCTPGNVDDVSIVSMCLEFRKINDFLLSGT